MKVKGIEFTQDSSGAQTSTDGDTRFTVTQTVTSPAAPAGATSAERVQAYIDSGDLPADLFFAGGRIVKVR